MNEEKEYIWKERYHGLFVDISKYLRKDGTVLTPEAIRETLQVDFDRSRADVIEAGMRLIAKNKGREDLYKLTASYILRQLQNK